MVDGLTDADRGVAAHHDVHFTREDVTKPAGHCLSGSPLEGHEQRVVSHLGQDIGMPGGEAHHELGTDPVDSAQAELAYDAVEALRLIEEVEKVPGDVA